MLLGHKKSQKSEQNWCLILNPLYNEIDKRKVARKITESFGLSPEESSDLVNNTPIILLDNLSQAVATQLKTYFRPTGAELLLTNDVFVKRKCYRTVWPEPPSLSFLHGAGAKPEEKKETPHEKLQPDDALNELRSIGKERAAVTPASPPEPVKPQKSEKDAGELQKLKTDLERLKKENERWQEKNEEQLAKIDKLNQDLLDKASNNKPISNQTAYDQDQEVEKHKTLLNNAEERYEGLQEEYRQARNLFEEKMTNLTQELEENKKKSDELEKQLQDVQQNKASTEAKVEEDSKKLIELENSKISVEKMLKEEQQLHQKQRQDYDHLKSLYDEKTSSTGQELENWKSYAAELSEKLKELEMNHNQMEQDLEIQSKNALVWQQKSEEVEKNLKEIQVSHQSIEAMMQENLKTLNERERELELAKRQVKELKTQAEQRDAVHKREQLAGIIHDREARLKELVKGQERMEREIKDRENVIREILTDQEKVEKDIIEAKQAQRHYLEIIKKESNSRAKITKIFSPTLSPSDKKKSPKDD